MKNRAIRIKKRDAWDALCGDFNERRFRPLPSINETVASRPLVRPSGANNFLSGYANRFRCWNFSDRADWNISDKFKFSGYNQFQTFTKDNARERTLFVLSIDGKGESKLIDTPGVHPHGWTNPASSLRKIVREFALSVPTIRSS